MNPLPILDIHTVSRNFGPLCALDSVNLSVQHKQIKGLIGPNGAGKTTLFNIISGILRPTRGSVVFCGKDITGLSPHGRCQSGIGRVFQISKLFWDETVIENVKTGYDCRTKYGIIAAGLRLRGVSKAENIAEEKSMQILETLGLAHKAEEPARNLPSGEQRLLEIARALATQPKLLLLDEPACGLNASETTNLIRVIDGIRQTGVSILLIEHNMRLVMEISDEVGVLDFGRKIAEGSPAEIQSNQAVISAYLG